MRRGIIFGLLVVLLAGVSFGAGILVDRQFLSVGRLDSVAPTPDNPASVNKSPYPSKEEVLAYLDGKTIPLPGDDKSAITFRREQVKALEVERAYVQVGNEPYSTGVHFIFTTEQGRYVADGRIRHNKVENERVFYGLEVSRWTKQ